MILPVSPGRRAAAVLLSALLLAPASALADGTALLRANAVDGAESLHVEWNDAGAVRIDMPGHAAYSLVLDGTAYVVSQMDGEPMVLSLSDMQGMGAAMGLDAPDGGMALDPDLATAVTDIRPTGARETVAGLDGAVYEIVWTDGSGQSHTDEAVLSDDPRAVDLTRAFEAFGAARTDMADARADAFATRGLGVLRYGDRFEVMELAAMDVPDERFVLPARPFDLRALMERAMPQGMPEGMGQPQQ